MVRNDCRANLRREKNQSEDTLENQTTFIFALEVADWYTILSKYRQNRVAAEVRTE